MPNDEETCEAHLSHPHQGGNTLRAGWMNKGEGYWRKIGHPGLSGVQEVPLEPPCLTRMLLFAARELLTRKLSESQVRQY